MVFEKAPAQRDRRGSSQETHHASQPAPSARAVSLLPTSAVLTLQHQIGKRSVGTLLRAGGGFGPVRLSGSPAPPCVHDVVRSPGQALEPSVRCDLEPRLGYDLSDTRVHTDEAAA